MFSSSPFFLLSTETFSINDMSSKHINDMFAACNNAQIMLYADDSNVFVKSTNLTDLFSLANDVCAQISKWFNSNRLTINYSKSNFILFFPTSNDECFISSNNLKIHINNNAIARTTCTKFLGIYLDETLNYKHHVNCLIKKLNSVNGMLYNRRDYISKQCLKNLYFALVFSRLQYGILIYGFATASTLKPLLICCNKILRTLQFQNRFSNVKQLYVYYNTLSIFQLHKLHIGKFVFKSLNCDFLVPDVIKEIFALSNDNSRKNYDTRLSNTKYL